jgi:hypothetical protein
MSWLLEPIHALPTDHEWLFTTPAVAGLIVYKVVH